MIGCYALWMLGTTWLAAVFLPLGWVATCVAIALHSSLQHEVLHGHPFRSRRLSEAMVFPAIGLAIPYMRFRDTHLAHHRDSILTDPYDDPESNYLDPVVWQTLPGWKRFALSFNNTLMGRMLIGPIVSQWVFVKSDLRKIKGGDRAALAGWLWHVPGIALVLTWLITVGAMPFWAYLLAAYGGLSLLKIRTFLEHQAHEKARGRTVVIEDRGPLAALFLNNNYHVVHHMHPAVPWYRLPALYQANRDRYLNRNDGYRYRSYGEVFRRYLFRAKDGVAHPLWSSAPVDREM
ncbi:fatty acid desaturase [Aliiroseovarius sp. YM-037]|uniref:fatty acid desaturase n=1 Tax=Aliiroseovarius sp. YM-037 TaxID=3341728 RepID=UPI003A806548